MIKKILLSIASIFLIFQSCKLLWIIDRMEIDSWGLEILIAWLINLFITGIFAFSGFAFPTQKLLPNSYYEVYEPNRLKKIFNLLKVETFRKMLLATLWKSKKQRKKHFNGKKNGIENLVEQSMKSEFGHLIPFVIVIFICIYFVTSGRYTLALFSFLINVIGNFYPILLQRHHRMRIQMINERRQVNKKIN